MKVQIQTALLKYYNFMQILYHYISEASFLHHHSLPNNGTW